MVRKPKCVWVSGNTVLGSISISVQVPSPPHTTQHLPLQSPGHPTEGTEAMQDPWAVPGVLSPWQTQVHSVIFMGQCIQWLLAPARSQNAVVF